jgi:predicted flap endonuclease-1-like 5' DNA nuclease
MYTFLGIFDNGWWTACTKDATFEILLMLLAAGIIGWLLRRFWSGDVKRINADWQLKYDKLTHDFNNAGKNTKNLKAEIEGLNLKLSKSGTATAEYESLKAKLENVQVQYEKVQAELAATKKEFAIEHEKLMAALKPAGEIEVLNNRLANMTVEMGIVKKNAETYKSSLDSAIAEKAKLAASLQVNEADELRRKVNRLENDLNSSRLMVTKYQDESRKMDERKTKLDEDAKLLNEQMADLEGLKTKLARSEEDLSRLRNSLSEYNQLRLDFDAMKIEKEKWQMEADVQASNAAEALAWRDKASAYEKELASAKAAAGEMEILKNKLSFLEAENERLSASFQTASITPDESEALKNIIRSLKSENAVLMDSVKAVKSDSVEVDGLKEKMQVLEADLQGSKNEYNILQKNYEALQAEKNSMVLTKAPGNNKDDLKVVEGIGPKIEELLNNAGIYTFRNLADAPVELLKEVLLNAGDKFKMHDPTNWPQQASLLSEGKMEEFQKLIDSLKGGMIA